MSDEVLDVAAIRKAARELAEESNRLWGHSHFVGHPRYVSHIREHGEAGLAEGCLECRVAWSRLLLT